MGLLSRLIVGTLPLAPKFLVGKVARRYVAGETLDEALDVVRRLNDLGAMATLDLLGEEVSERQPAVDAVDEYLRMFDGIDSRELDSNVSIKLTLLGLKIDETFCCDNVEKIVVRARESSNFVRLDMEDRTCTDATLRIYHRLFERHGNVGAVLQAYMRRTLMDIGELPPEGANVRLCKGIYIEPRQVAWKGYETVRANFVAALEKLFEQEAYVGIATHDEYLVNAATSTIDRLGLTPDLYEFQMLYGVDEELRDILLDFGHRVRIYVPYGRDWYPYSIRRLRENPEIAMHVARAFLGIR